MPAPTRRYRAMSTADGWRIYDDESRRWSEVMERGPARWKARLLNETPGRDLVRWELAQREVA